MITATDTYLPQPPQSGRPANAIEHDDDQAGLWSQVLAVFRDIGGTFDPFANDGHPEVRALGRAARQRRIPQADDYFALGDTCARLALQDGQLSETYVAKTIGAYARAGELAPGEARAARNALFTFAQWVVDVARALGGYEALKSAALACERVEQLEIVEARTAERAHLREQAQRLHEQMARIAAADTGATQDGQAGSRESQLLCDQGQMLLRNSQPKEAFALFERALQADSRNHAAWLWRAMALTDMGRYQDALASYDQALAIESDNARVWNSKGALLTELGRAEEALECLDRALELSPADAKVRAIFWLNKGKALFICKRYPEARHALIRSYQLDPGPESAAGIAACREQIEMTSVNSSAVAS
jgi:tetratricopeptide (TPR) repeat protein